MILLYGHDSNTVSMIGVSTLSHNARYVHALVLQILGNGISTLLRKFLVCIGVTLG